MILTSSNWNDKTHGNKKIDTYFRDLLRNKQFQEEIKAWRILIAKEKWSLEKVERVFNLYKEYEKEEVKLKRYLRSKDSYKLKKEICLKYNLSDNWFSTLTSTHAMSVTSHSFDTCNLEDWEDRAEPINIHYFHAKFENFDDDIFPINIKIHNYATKRDLINFIETRWPDIALHLKKKRFKSRKIDNKMLDFIWDNRTLGTKQIKKELDVKFPSNDLVYFEINKIISDERKRLKKMGNNDNLLPPYWEKIDKYRKKTGKSNKKVGNNVGQ